MSAGIWFWLLFVLSVVFGFWCWWPNPPSGVSPTWTPYRPLGGLVVIFILLALLGWSVFGAPLK